MEKEAWVTGITKCQNVSGVVLDHRTPGNPPDYGKYL